MEHFVRLLEVTTKKEDDPVTPNPCVAEGNCPVPAWQFVVIVFLALLSGAFSGLNLGLLGLDVKNLELLTKGPFNSEEEALDAKYAQAILPLRRRGNLLLCTILLGNVTVNSGLSILMGDLTSGIMGLIISTAIITIFGEIIPQAVCSRYALIVGAHTTWLVYFFMFITFPIAFPISAIIDKVLGEEVGNILSKTQMKRMFEMLEDEHVIKSSERKIIQAALELQEKTTYEVMTPIENVYMLEINTPLDHRMLREIYSKGFSRIPIYEHNKNNIIGILMARDLILINPDKALISLKQMSSIIIRDVIAVGSSDKLEPLLGYFKKGLTHIGIVTQIEQTDDVKEPTKKVVGIVTLEDIIEEIIMDEIEDEYELMDEKLQRKILKAKLSMLFTDHEAQKVLNEEEIKACLEYLQKYVKPFQPNRIKRDIMNILIRKSSVIEIECDESPFSHNIDQQDELSPNVKHNRISDQQYMYNQLVKKEATRIAEEENVDNVKNQVKQAPEPQQEQEGDDEYKPELLASMKIKGQDAGQIELKEISLVRGKETNRSMGKDPEVPMERQQSEQDLKDSLNRKAKNYICEADPNTDLLQNEELDDMINPILYVRGVPSQDFYLILTGKVMICSGNEGFFLEQGAFNYMGVECLTNDKYVPDFSAKIIGKAKLLKINRQDYRKSLIHLQNQKGHLR